MAENKDMTNQDKPKFGSPEYREKYGTGKRSDKASKSSKGQADENPVRLVNDETSQALNLTAPEVPHATLTPEEARAEHADPASPEASPAVNQSFANAESLAGGPEEAARRAEAQKKADEENMKSAKSENRETSPALRVRTKALTMKESLESQPKVRFFVPLTGGEKPGSFVPVTLNGYTLNVPKGKLVDIPQQVAEVLAESLNIDLEVGSAYRLDRNQDKEKALE